MQAWSCRQALHSVGPDYSSVLRGTAASVRAAAAPAAHNAATVVCWRPYEKEYSCPELLLCLLSRSLAFVGLSQAWQAFILYSNARVTDLKVFIMQQVFFRHTHAASKASKA